VGEIALDLLLLQEIKNLNKEVIVTGSRGAITSDVTLEDLEEVGMKEVADKIIPSGPDTLGISFEEMSLELKQALMEVDLVIAKGQANFYAFSENRSKIRGAVASLFTSKCDVVSRLFDRTGKINIVKLL